LDYDAAFSAAMKKIKIAKWDVKRSSDTTPTTPKSSTTPKRLRAPLRQRDTES
jgi:hypothetical protein